MKNFFLIFVAILVITTTVDAGIIPVRPQRNSLELLTEYATISWNFIKDPMSFLAQKIVDVCVKKCGSA